MPHDPTLGLYLSVPFCRAKCSFCNFASGVGNGEQMDLYVTQLCAEISSAHQAAATLGTELPHHVDTLYFGGGTPSLLSPSQLDRIFTALHSQFSIDPAAEITLEAAPGQIAPALLDHARRLGVNRISLGVQSFVDRECSAVGRLHTEKDCTQEIIRLRNSGVPEVCADLIAGLPYQTPASWTHSLDVASAIGLTHLSVYMLEIDEDSRLGREVLQSGPRFHAPAVPSDDLSAAMYELACERLPHLGFPQYEISNFAAPAHRSRHNLKYWHRDPYLGFGLDAHSMLFTSQLFTSQLFNSQLQGREAAGSCRSALRLANPDDLSAYPGPPTLTPITLRDAFEETVFLGLRLNGGLSTETLRNFPPAWLAALETNARSLLHEGLLSHTAGIWSLTVRGRMISNDVFGHLLTSSSFAEKRHAKSTQNTPQEHLNTPFFELTTTLSH